MRSYTFVTAALFLTVSAAGSASAAVEVTFLQSLQMSSARVVTYTPGQTSTLQIMSSPLNGAPSLVSGLALLKAPYGPGPEVFMPVEMLLWAESTASVVQTGVQFEQTGFHGQLSYSWVDPISQAVVNLLTATFSNATLNVDLGQTPSGSFFSTLPNQSIAYKSDVFDVENAIEADFALAFSSISSAFVAKSGVGTAFEANVVGTFAAAVPEPATWAMMIAGFGMVGFAARRRRGLSVVTA